jgi:hypothetical protein
VQSLILRQEHRTQLIDFARSLSSNRGSPLGVMTPEFMSIVSMDPKVIAATEHCEEVKKHGNTAQKDVAVSRLHQTRCSAVAKIAQDTPSTPLSSTCFMPPLRATIMGMMFAETDQQHGPALVRSLRKLCESTGKEVSNYKCSNSACPRYKVPFRSQWELLRHNDISNVCERAVLTQKGVKSLWSMPEQ